MAGYLLNRDSNETQRLTLQHNIFINSFGYHINPLIKPTLPPNAVIADIGTGSGIWMLDTAEHEPQQSHQYIGFDISSAQFPQTPLPYNISFELHDFLTPFPEHWHNKFDLVHIRILLLALPDQAAWNTAAANVQRILKPGGWLQWEEADFSVVHRVMRDAHTPDGDDPAALRKGLARLLELCGPRVAHAPEKLWAGMASAGFAAMREDFAATDRAGVQMRKMATWNEIGALEGLQKAFRAKEAEEARRRYGDPAGDEELIREMYAEAEKGYYCMLLNHCVIGRKGE